MYVHEPQDDVTVLLSRLRALVEDESKSETIRRCGVVLQEIARHENGSIFLFPEDREQVRGRYKLTQVLSLFLLARLNSYICISVHLKQSTSSYFLVLFLSP